jgi:hypothetical protein
VENNVISDMCYETSDVGAFYLGRRWDWRGIIVRDNTFKSIRTMTPIAGMWMLCATGVTVQS